MAGTRAPDRRGLSAALTLSVLLLVSSGCAKPEPLYFTDFMEDRFAREGTLARCNQDRDASLNDIECANARRAAAAIALREERARRQQFEQESERKLDELRAEVERQRQSALAAQVEAEAAARAAYEAQWREGAGGQPPVGIDGQPLIDLTAPADSATATASPIDAPAGTGAATVRPADPGTAAPLAPATPIAPGANE